ncbi:MAG: 4Fe-4S dicluster domain-containing protein [Bacillota bacterium]
MKQQRQIIKIDRDKCNGCGQCITACHEGALAIVNGKAEIVADHFCDGLGACIGDCPQGALTFETRDADAFDETAVAAHLANQPPAASHQQPEPLACGCPGTMAKKLPAAGFQPLAASHQQSEHCGCGCSDTTAQSAAKPVTGGCGCNDLESRLQNWPVQLQLIPVNAPYLDDANLVLAAHCAGFADPNFHGKFLHQHSVLTIACPKLDDAEKHTAKLAELIAMNDLRSITIVRMEVPCCGGLERIVADAVKLAKKPIFIKTIEIAV